MYLHLGQDYIVPLQSVVAVFDMDTATASKRTRLLLDDVLSELDRRRQDFVLNRISAGQVMITCCEDGISEKLRAGAVFHIQNGKKSAETH